MTIYPEPPDHATMVATAVLLALACVLLLRGMVLHV